MGHELQNEQTGASPISISEYAQLNGFCFLWLTLSENFVIYSFFYC